MGPDEFISAYEFYESSRLELKEFVRPKVLRILLLTFLFYPVSFLFFGKWAGVRRWSLIGWLYLAPLAIFFVMAIMSGIIRPVGHDPYRVVAIYMGIGIPFLWPITLLHTYKIRMKYTVLTASQQQLHEWLNSISHKKSKEERLEREYQAELRRQEHENDEHRRRVKEEADAMERRAREVEKEKQERYERARQQANSNARSGSQPHATKTSDDKRWESTDPYVILGITRGSSGAEVRRAWLRLIAQWHPDRASASFITSQGLHKTRSQKINWARSQCERSSSSTRAA